MSTDDLHTVDPAEVMAVATRVVAFIGEHVASSPEVIVAALKSAASVVEETRNAHFTATQRAHMSEMIRRLGRG